MKKVLLSNNQQINFLTTLKDSNIKTAKDNELALDIASSGFRDMTRLAMSNPEMANDMITMNADNIEKSILKLYKSIGDLTSSDYLEQINEIRSNRQKMFL